MGAILWGHEGRVPTSFSDGGTYSVVSPYIFLLRFVFGEVSKLNVTFVTFCVKSFSCKMLHTAMLVLKQNLVWCH